MRFMFLFIFLFPFVAQAGCLIRNSDKSPTLRQGDALFLTLAAAKQCPENVQALKAELIAVGANIEPAMVGNRGFHNPELGSFSFFETVTGHLAPFGLDVHAGDFFFGHFTGATDDHRLVLDQEPSSGKLMVELIAWDANKKLFNFYELIGQGGPAQWFYRGDSADVLRDNTFVYREVPPGQPKFGKTLRCSGCHSSGGPIMKELAFPHNDWWTIARPLPLGSNQPSQEVTVELNRLIDAGTFAQNVVQGIEKLEKSPTYKLAKAKLSLQEQLRPLFCENEINLESSDVPFSRSTQVKIPSGFFINTRLAAPQLTVSQASYNGFLSQNNMHFPETNLADADHPWLTPVKGFSDQLALQSLIDEGLVEENFVLSVLAVDMERPLFSQARCALLKEVPEFSVNWKQEFLQKLQVPSSSSAAKQLAQYLSDPSLVVKKVREYSTSLQAGASQFQKLIQVRKAVFASEISQNPRGQILEPGFRVIFPLPQK